MDILFIRFEICRLDLGILCLNRDIFMLSILYFIFEHPASVSFCTTFTMENNIASPPSWVLEVYADLKFRNLSLESVVK